MNNPKIKVVTVGFRFLSLVTIVVLAIFSVPVFAESQTSVELCHNLGPNEVTIVVAEPAVNGRTETALIDTLDDLVRDEGFGDIL